MPDIADLQPGDPTDLAGYHVVGRLGAGGQGVVYLAVAPSGDKVAIKQLHLTFPSEGAHRRLTEEVAAARRVAPFCTAQVLDAELDGPSPYIVSEYIEGLSLQQHVQRFGPMSGAALQRLAVSTVTALAAIHHAGVVHRDFKPANVMLAPDGPRVIDFGIAHDLSAQNTLDSAIFGTPAYTSPEQLRAEPISPGSDIFTWASVVAFAATGRAPFEAADPSAVMFRIVSGEPDLTGVDPGWVALLRRCLDKDAARRPSAQQALALLLGRLPGGDDVANTLELLGEPPASGDAEPNHLASGDPESADAEAGDDGPDDEGPSSAEPGDAELDDNEPGPARPGDAGPRNPVPAADTAAAATIAAIRPLQPPAPPATTGGPSPDPSAQPDLTLRLSGTVPAPRPAGWSRILRSGAASRLSSRTTRLTVAAAILLVGLVIAWAITRNGNSPDDAAGLVGAGSPTPGGVTVILPTSPPTATTSSTGTPDPSAAATSDAPTTAPERTTVAPTTIPAAFAGRWQGPVQQPPGSASTFSTQLTLTAGLRTGTVSYPELGCSGTVRVVSASAGELVLSSEVGDDPRDQCASDATIRLTPQGQQLSFRWVDAARPDNKAAAILTKS